MSEEMYGDEPQPKPKVKRKSKALKETPKKKVEIEGYLLRVQAMGSTIEIVSPIPRDQFVERWSIL